MTTAADSDVAATSTSPHVVEVAESVYAYLQPDGTWWLNNTGFVVGRHGVVSIDACATEQRTRAYQTAIAGVTDQPVRVVVNTHHHGDHTFGNYLFDGAAIVAHEAIRGAIEAWGEPRSAPYWTPIEFGSVRLAPPFLTYREEITVWSDDLRCEVRHVGGPAHTTNDSIVWIPDRGVLFSGDLLFHGGTPFLLQGSIAGSLRVMEDVLAPLQPEVVVPGHGPVADASLIDEVIGYLRFIQGTARAGHAAGLSPLELARETDLGPYANLADSERLVGNLHRAYAEIDGSPPGAPIDLQAALADMVTFNGGPLVSHA